MKNIRLRIGTFVVLLFAGLSLFAQQMLPGYRFLPSR